jgi:DNA-binding response OmpR family regulator
MQTSRRRIKTVLNCCPTCGGPLANDDLRVDLGSNTLLGYGTALIVTARQAELCSVLANAFPYPVARQQIIAKIWGYQDISDDLLDVTIHQTRLKIERLGYSIKNERGVGFRIFKLR